MLYCIQVISTGFQSYFVDWTNSGELLAVAGKIREIAVKSNHTIRYINSLRFYNDLGHLIYSAKIPCETVRFHILKYIFSLKIKPASPIFFSKASNAFLAPCATRNALNPKS